MHYEGTQEEIRTMKIHRKNMYYEDTQEKICFMKVHRKKYVL